MGRDILEGVPLYYQLLTIKIPAKYWKVCCPQRNTWTLHQHLPIFQKHLTVKAAAVNGKEKGYKSARWSENFQAAITYGKGMRLIAIAPFKDNIGTDTLFSHEYVHGHVCFWLSSRPAPRELTANWAIICTRLMCFLSHWPQLFILIEFMFICQYFIFKISLVSS